MSFVEPLALSSFVDQRRPFGQPFCMRAIYGQEKRITLPMVTQVIDLMYPQCTGWQIFRLLFSVTYVVTLVQSRVNKLPYRPDMIRNPRFHRGGHAKALVYPAEIVVREVQGASCF